MTRATNRRNPEGRRDGSAPARAAVVIAAALCCVAIARASAEAISSGAARPAKGVSAEIALAIRTSLPAQYETTVLLEDRDAVSLLLEYEAPVRGGYEQRVRWWCDGGRLEHEDSLVRNRFYPPLRAAVSTIQAELGLYPRQAGRTAKIPAFKKNAVLRVISSSPGMLLHDGEIDGFRIGRYLDPTDPEIRKEFNVANSWALIYPERFLRPSGFYLVDETSHDLRISRHFRLGDFALDYQWFSLGKRQYIALDYGLVRKMEDLVDELNRAGLPGDKIVIIYAFRPPAYNTDRVVRDSEQSLKAPFSFHQYGKAVDFILDADGDLRLDDLDGDGRITVRDAAALAHYVNVLDRRYRARAVLLYGGAGIYDHHDFWERPVQTPYVHMDVRGFLDENGHLIRWPSEWPDTGEPIAWGKL